MSCLALLVIAVLAVLNGCAAPGSEGPPPVASGPNAPILEASYAAQVIPLRDTWLIYLKGSDADGDLEYINVWPQVSLGPTTPSRIRVAADQRAHLNGYLTLPTGEIAPDADDADFMSMWIRLRVFLEDAAGHQSEPVTLNLQFVEGGGKVPPPPPGVFQERHIGNIAVLIQ